MRIKITVRNRLIIDVATGHDAHDDADCHYGDPHSADLTPVWTFGFGAASPHDEPVTYQ